MLREEASNPNSTNATPASATCLNSRKSSEYRGARNRNLAQSVYRVVFRHLRGPWQDKNTETFKCCRGNTNKPTGSYSFNKTCIWSPFPCHVSFLGCHKLSPTGLKVAITVVLRHETSSPGQTLGSWVQIQLEAWMPVCVYSVLLLSCVCSGLETGGSPVQEVLLTVYKFHSSWVHLNGNRPQGLTHQNRRKFKDLKISVIYS
jgi:hypothetical protein